MLDHFSSARCSFGFSELDFAFRAIAPPCLAWSTCRACQLRCGRTLGPVRMVVDGMALPSIRALTCYLPCLLRQR
jgi:hypothetical protein